MLDYYTSQDCMREICKDLKRYVIKIIYCEKKEMIPLPNEENVSYFKQKVIHICKKEFTLDINSCSKDMYTKYR